MGHRNAALVFFENMYLSAGVLFPVFLVANLTSTLGHFGLCRSTWFGMICCACAWWHASTQHASGFVQAGQWLCRRWYTWYDGQLGTSRKTCQGSSGEWILEKWLSVTVAKCALLFESLDLVLDMFCKFHRCFEEISALSLGEAGEWLFLDFIFCTVRSKRRFSLCRRI